MNDSSSFARQYLDDLGAVLKGLDLAALARAMDAIAEALRQRRQIFLAGNGGSAMTASHMANDLLKTSEECLGHGARAIALTDNAAVLTAIANDSGYEWVFSRQLAALAEPDDLLIVLSASGNSPNIIRVVEEARKHQLITIGFLGMGGGKVKSMVDLPVVVPSKEYGFVEDAHMIFDHLIAAFLRSSISS
jgi:D-sedoheptulose 7-phosphate isomerase